MKVAGIWCYVYRAIDEHGQVVDVYVSKQRTADDAAAFFRQVVEAPGTTPLAATTDCTAAYPSALAAVLPNAVRETGRSAQQRIERDHQYLKGRVRGMRGFKTLTGARVLRRAHAFVRPYGADTQSAARILALRSDNCHNRGMDGVSTPYGLRR